MNESNGDYISVGYNEDASGKLKLVAKFAENEEEVAVTHKGGHYQMTCTGGFNAALNSKKVLQTNYVMFKTLHL